MGRLLDHQGQGTVQGLHFEEGFVKMNSISGRILSNISFVVLAGFQPTAFDLLERPREFVPQKVEPCQAKYIDQHE